MISVLIYSRNNDFMSKVMADQLSQLGYATEQTSVLNLPRLLLNRFQVLHLIVDHLPLTTREMLYLTTAKKLGKSTVLSLLNAGKNESSYLKNQVMKWIDPDALTVSQTNYLKIFRFKPSSKMIIPSLLDFSNEKIKKSDEAIGGFLFPLIKSLDEGLGLKSTKPVYFDGRKLVNKNNSSALRKKWTKLLSENKIPAYYHLILSDEKLQDILTSGPLALIVASHEMLHTEFTNWLKISLLNHHLLVLNPFQATGFSSHWTSGHNCLVISSHHWLDEINAQMANPIFQHSFTVSNISKSSIDTVFNDLSRLYTKIVYQKTSLLDSDSAKIQA